jgi:3-oxoacyl-[acyl-carrier-protein] synthase II
MKPVALLATGAVSALGQGPRAYAVGALGEPARSAVAHDPEFEALGLRRPQSARVALELGPGFVDRAGTLLAIAARDLLQGLEQRLPDWRTRRVGFVIGTSGGGLSSLERLLDERAAGHAASAELARGSFYFGPLARLGQELSIEPVRSSLVLSACASSTFALGLGARWLEAGHADLVIAGGFDALCGFIASGFEALGATAATLPQPFRLTREGMALGEGAALAALVRAEEARGEPLGYVLGFGSSCDAVHVTAPDRTGSGLASAGTAAITDAGLQPAEVDIVSAHATSTPFNDAAEANAITRCLGAAAERTVVHPFKAVIGHTLGAAGALESLAALSALSSALLPAAVGAGPIEPNLSARLLEQNDAGRPGFCLKLSSAFGGSNSALVLGARTARHARPRPRRSVAVRAVGRPRLELDVERVSERLGIESLRLARLDPGSQLALAACDSALEALDTKLPPEAGVIVGTVAATLEVNEAYFARLRERGARSVEPRRFPATSPNLAAGECSIAFGLRGPSLAVGAGPAACLEALLVACDLLEAGDAPALLVAAVEWVGPTASEIFRAAGLPVPPSGAVALVLSAGDDAEAAPLDRARLEALHHQALSEGGALAPAAPGYPTLLEALGRLEQ